jgi:hypothetical protein
MAGSRMTTDDKPAPRKYWWLQSTLLAAALVCMAISQLCRLHEVREQRRQLEEMLAKVRQR